MAIAQLEYPRFKAFNTSNKALSGGKVFVYEAGTSTKATIWQDADKNSQHSNPVTLDTNGEAEIWFEGPVKVVLEDADGNQQWTMDDIESDIPPTDVGRFNQVENGSFEIDEDADNLPDDWVITTFDSTSTVEIDTTNVVHGTNSLKFVSQGAGGGTATTIDFFPVNSGRQVTVVFSILSSVADVQNSVSVRWFDKDQTFISATTVYNESTNNPTSFEEKRFTAQAPSTATYAKLKLVGCDSADATPGTTYFDDVKAYVDEQAAVFSSNDVWEFTGTGGSVTASAAELNKMDGVTATTSEINVVDGLTATTTELNNLDGYTGSTANLNNISGLSVDISGINSYPFNAGDLAAGSVGQSEISAGAVHQGELDTNSGTVSGNGNLTLPGGQYGFYPQVKGGTSLDAHIAVGADYSAGYTTSINLNSSSFDALQRYINSSPPYNLGDGECGLFIEVSIDSNGEIIGFYVAPDPVWANNGPTDISPDYIDKHTGKKYKRVKRPQVTRADVNAGRVDLDDLIAAKREAPIEEVEITPEYKNADMDLFPHSWVSPPQGTIAMLDPVNTHDLLMLHEDGEDIADLLHKGFILPGNPINRHGPPGVQMISFKWKNTKK